jgi:hypothetical protein
MLKSFLAGTLILYMVLNFGCAGPFNTSSDGTARKSKDPNRGMVANRVEETLAAGTVIRASFEHPLRAEDIMPGDPFTMKVVDSLEIDDKTVVPVGSTIKGVVAESNLSGRVKGRAQMLLRFTELVLPDGKSYTIQTAGVFYLAPTVKERNGATIERASAARSRVGAPTGEGNQTVGATSGISFFGEKETGLSAGSTLNVKLMEPLKMNLS